MNGYGLELAVITFFIIGIFHPIVIKAEYHFTRRCWPVFLAAGVLLIGGSFFAENIMVSGEPEAGSGKIKGSGTAKITGIK